MRMAENFFRLNLHLAIREEQTLPESREIANIVSLNDEINRLFDSPVP